MQTANNLDMAPYHGANIAATSPNRVIRKREFMLNKPIIRRITDEIVVGQQPRAASKHNTQCRQQPFDENC